MYLMIHSRISSHRKCDDALFEALNMLINVALWFTKHAAKIAGAKDEPSMDEAKEVHKCLRRAAGIFKFIKENVGRLLQVSFLSRVLLDPTCSFVSRFVRPSTGPPYWCL